MTRNATARRLEREARENYPDPGETPLEHLRHTLAVFKSEEHDDRFVVTATSGIYGDGVKTGLTWDDLRAILAQLDA